ncbi:MAG: CPBP family intramembrane metalloprotease [Bacilli bacterium]|nr:CPBP family intramembrane metalloprotease [Bacilli bacterium]
MSYIKKLLASLKYIIITYILLYTVIIISCIIYKLIINKSINTFIHNTLPYITIITLTIIIIYLYKNNKRKESRNNYKIIPVFISIGISISCLLNMIIFKIFPPVTISKSLSLPLLVISSCLIGPIYEEILYRYIFLNSLKKFNSSIKAIIINSIIFSLMHFNIKEIFFAFFLSLIINIIYQKYNNILYPIVIHQSANITSLFLIEYNSQIFLLSIICILISFEITRNSNKY